MRRRAAAVFLILFAAYAGTIGLDSFDDSEYGGDEPHYLLTAESLVEDGDLDLIDDYRSRDYADFYPYPLDQHGQTTDGRLHEPHGAGFPALVAPAFALGGPTGVELLMALVAALAMALAYLLAVRVVPDPWALGATLAVGLSPPVLAYGTAVYPELAAGACLAGAALLVVRLEEGPRRRHAAGCFALLGLLPWLGTKFVPAGIVLAVIGFRAITRRGRRLLAIVSIEIALISVSFYVGINQALYGGPTPYAADDPGQSATDANSVWDYLERSYRAIALWIDRDYGLLRWAPVLALGFFGLWLLWRAKRESLARALPAHAGAERTAEVCALIVGIQLLVAVFLAPTMFGFWFPGRHFLAALPVAVPLVAWGLHHAPRVGAALAALTLAASVWLYLDVLLGAGGLAAGRPDAPFGPLTDTLPLFESGAVLPFAVAGAIAMAVLALCLREWLHWRNADGATFTRYSG